MCGLHSFRGWNYDLRDDFFRSKVVFALGFSVRNDVKLFKRKLAFAFRALESDFGGLGDQHRNSRRGAHALCRTVIA